MFTGIIEEVGTITSVEALSDGTRFRVSARTVLEGISLGDSIAVDGVCLTAAELFPDGFAVVAVASTLSRTTLRDAGVGKRVNLERALAFGGRLGGHLVQGHVDGVGTVEAIRPLGDSTLIDFTLTPDVAAVTILHGSITVNGISLTVNALPSPSLAQVSIVPFTSEHTTIGDLRVGDSVNLEGDLLGKYVRHLLGTPGGDAQHLSSGWGY